jgi:hypothetical protein
MGAVLIRRFIPAVTATLAVVHLLLQKNWMPALAGMTTLERLERLERGEVVERLEPRFAE